MKRLILGVVLVTTLGWVAYLRLTRVDDTPGEAPLVSGAPATADVVARGEYLTRAADCVACHTITNSGRPFAGGVAFKSSIGTLYSKNITPDSNTGIGGWSDAEFVRAVRTGIGRHGEQLYPAFPYNSYTQMSRDDVLAIKAYLATLRPIRQANRTNDLSFPFDQRWTLRFWKVAFFKDRRFAPEPLKSAEWNSGAYLTTALGHCAECHTPRNVGFGLKHSQGFAGAELQGWRAYNITMDPSAGIGAWSDAELASYLKKGVAAGRASAGGPMGEAVAHSLQYLDSHDIAAIIAFLRTVPPRRGEDPIEVDRHPAPVVASSEARPSPAELSSRDSGLALFAGACASCHQWDGTARQSPFAALIATRGVNDAQGANVTQTILSGTTQRIGGAEVYMPAFGAAYSDSEVAALANFVIGHFGGKRGEVTAEQVEKRRNL